MPHCTRTKEDVAGRVADMFRIAESRDDLDLKRLSLLSGLDYGSLNNYRNGTAIPLHAFVQLAPHIPDDLLSMCVKPAGKIIVPEEAPDGGAHDLAKDSGDYQVTYLSAIDPESEAGAALSHRERAQLQAIQGRMKSRKVA